MALETNATITPTILMNPRTPRVINDYLPNSAISSSVCALICDCEASQREVAIARDCSEVDGWNRRDLAVGGRCGEGPESTHCCRPRGINYGPPSTHSRHLQLRHPRQRRNKYFGL
jgi:hypothetical protein